MGEPALDMDRRDPCPYDDLFIYYIQGRLNRTEPAKGRGFIGNWEEEGFSFLFFSKPADDEVAEMLKENPGVRLLDRYQMGYEEWQGGRIEPLSIGDWFIAPPWNRTPTPTGMNRLTLDPGVVFGTGTHPTTRDCLEMIRRVCDREAVETVADVGTGTGLLALAAARTGCKRVLAFDFNRLAVETARRNILLNGLEERVLAFQGRAEDFMAIPADLRIANIHFDVMKHLLDSPDFCNSRWFILSGLLRSEARETAAMLARLPAEVLETRVRDGIWHTFLGISRR